MIEVLNKKKELKDISLEWNRLAAKLESPLLSFEWFFSFIEAFSLAEKNIKVIVVRSGSRISAIAPLVVVERNSIKWLELIGVSVLYEPCGLLYEDNLSLKQLVAKMVGLKLPFILQRISTDSHIVSEICQVRLRKGIVIQKDTAGSNYVPIHTTWDEYFSTVSSQRRYNLRRKNKRAEKIGNTSVQVFSPAPEELDQYLDTAFSIEGAGWKGKAGSALKKNERLAFFFRQFLKAACAKNILRLCFYTIAEEHVGMLIGLEASGRFWVLKLGYDEKWAQYSPGMHVSNETIRYAFQENFKSYEFLGSAEEWQNAWPIDSHDFSTLIVFPYSISGFMALCTELSRISIKKGNMLCQKISEKFLQGK